MEFDGAGLPEPLPHHVQIDRAQSFDPGQPGLRVGRSERAIQAGLGDVHVQGCCRLQSSEVDLLDQLAHELVDHLPPSSRPPILCTVILCSVIGHVLIWLCGVQFGVEAGDRVGGLVEQIRLGGFELDP